MRTKRAACRNDLCVRPVPHNAGSTRYRHAAGGCLDGVLTDIVGALCANIESARARFSAGTIGGRNEDACLLRACGGLCLCARRGLFRKHLCVFRLIGRKIGQPRLGTICRLTALLIHLVRMRLDIGVLLVLAVRALLHRVGVLHIRADVCHHDIETCGANPRRAVCCELCDGLFIMRRDVCRIARVEFAVIYNALDGRLEVVDGDADARTHGTC